MFSSKICRIGYNAMTLMTQFWYRRFNDNLERYDRRYLIKVPVAPSHMPSRDENS